MRTLPPLSLVTAGRIFVAVAVAYAFVAAALSFSFLRDIESDARSTREQRIPQILARNVNAVKVERISSLVRSAYLARDPQMERRIQMEARALAQSFSLDRDEVLVRGGKRVADAIQTIVAMREHQRSANGAKDEEDPLLRDVYEDAMHVGRDLAAHLTTDAAMVADVMADNIEQSARKIGYAWMFILSIPVLGSIAFSWSFRMLLTRPIDATIDRLTAIGSQRFEETAVRAPLFSELRTIAAAVETYGRLSNELSRTNAVLQVMSHQDSLTGIGNRRSFEAMLDAEVRKARVGNTTFAVLLIDLDHFKRINDEHGHQTGDACLRTVGSLLRSFCGAGGYHPARYGGEEFAVLVPDVDAEAASAFAEELRVAIAAATVPVVGGSGSIRMTASIGFVVDGGNGVATPIELLSAADHALYGAKRAGRDRVCDHRAGTGPLRVEQHAA